MPNQHSWKAIELHLQLKMLRHTERATVSVSLNFSSDKWITV